MPLPTPSQQIAHFQKRQRRILDTIQQLVEIESPSDLKAAVDRLSTVLASRFGDLGGKVKLHRIEKFGNQLQADFRGKDRGRKPVLLLGHVDTVYPVGTISKMRYRVANGRVFGPGVLDMKAGIALALHVIEALLQWHGGRLPGPVTVLLVSDEEIGSASSRAITEKLAQQSEAVLVLEPAYGIQGAVKTSRKGIGAYKLQVTGKAAHSGLDFEKGQSAVLELAQQVVEISKLASDRSGVTVNVGTIAGGSRVNVVPANASGEIDLRVSNREDGEEMHRRLTSLKAFNPNCKIAVTGGINRPPMCRTEGVAGLYGKAQAIARDLGWQLEEASVGGGSDGNFTAALGVPTLDGLGAVGEGAHADHESVVVSELPRRAALLAGLILSV
jgi:glutamate carboxypeptidase